MKVIFVTDLDLWSMGEGKGGEAFTRTVTKYLNEGDEVFLLSDVEGNGASGQFDKNRNIVVKATVFKRWVSIRKVGLVFRLLDHRIMNRRFAKEMAKILHKHGCEETVLYAYELFGVKACKKVSKRFAVPFVSRFQGTKMVAFPYSMVNRVLRYPHFQALETESDLIIMTDDGSKGDVILDSVGNTSRRLFLKNGLELREKEVFERVKKIDRMAVRKRLGINDDEMMFLTVSRLTGWKRVDRAINGMASFIKNGGKGKLIIVGDGNQRYSLEALAEKLCIKEKVVFEGAIKHEEVYSYMIASDIFLSLYDMSNVGNPLLEAMTLGKCIVTLDVGDTKSVINGKTGVLLSERELCNLGEILFELSNNKKKRKMHEEYARRFAEKNLYTWEERMKIEYREVSKLVKH